MSITPFFHVYHKYVFIMSNISKIKISGTSYSIKDENACNVVELTQAQYDDLPTTAKTSNSLFFFFFATAGDLSNYYTKSETDNAITAATSTKQDTLVSGTNIKTINGETLLGEGNITIQGGSGGVTIDQSLDSSSTNAVANSAVSAALNYNDMFLYRVDPKRTWDNHPTGVLQLRWRNPYNGSTATTQDNITLMKINNIPLIEDYVSGISNLNLVETSVITTSISNSSTDSQVPSAKAVYDIVGNIETLLSQI